MLQGKTQSALRYLSRNTNDGVLQLDDLVPETANIDETEMHTVRNILHNKHPLGKDPLPCILLNGEPDSVNLIIFNADTIRQVALHTHGAAGPSGLDAQTWRCRSSFKSASTNSCNSVLPLPAWVNVLQLLLSIQTD